MTELSECHTQEETLDELNRRIKEAIELYLEVKAKKITGNSSPLTLKPDRAKKET